MSLVCVTSAKGSPGVTLAALGLAAAWPLRHHQRKVLLEADPAGGALATRYGLGRQPGLLSLAAAGAHGLTRDDLWKHVQELPGGLGVVCGPERADRSRGALATAGPQLGRWFAQHDHVSVVADCGRYTPGDVACSLVEHATVAFMVARPTAEQIQPAAAAARHLTSRGVDVRWLLVGERPHRSTEVADVTGIPVARVLPHDPRGSARLAVGATRAHGAGRLVRHFSDWARETAALVSAGPRTESRLEGAEQGSVEVSP